jgi:large subunit ribosomal protein L17
MRHLKAGRRLNRNAAHRLAMFRNMAMALFRKERIVTTVAKAKEARSFIEKLITLAKKDTLHHRRLVLARLGTPSKAEVQPAADVPKHPEKADPTHIIIKLFRDIAPRYIDRPGGYTRVLKRSQRRLGDASETAYLELVRPGETRRKKKGSPAPAPLAPKPPEPVASAAPASEPTPAATEPTSPAPQASAEETKNPPAAS